MLRDNDFRDVLYTKAMEDAVSTFSADTAPYSELCPLHRPPRDPPPLLRAASMGKNKALPPPKKTPARSLGDLKVCRGLVARFLHRPKHGVHGHKQEGIHLRSCGDLSSTSSLRRLLSARRRPRSLSGSCKESAL
ncbi:protein FAM189B-like [Phasianus colchicus]|uniref:protein FAM189B-like n=1 Tax=Phasianus colchicus TaxID=9054 RepID=UPI00129E627A|nr:protein FAM189B-like [Phasianus colchicus]